jgi:hypothetical protein
MAWACVLQPPSSTVEHLWLAELGTMMIIDGGIAFVFLQHACWANKRYGGDHLHEGVELCRQAACSYGMEVQYICNAIHVFFKAVHWLQPVLFGVIAWVTASRSLVHWCA